MAGSVALAPRGVVAISDLGDAEANACLAHYDSALVPLGDQPPRR